MLSQRVDVMALTIQPWCQVGLFQIAVLATVKNGRKKRAQFALGSLRKARLLSLTVRIDSKAQ